MRIVLISSAPPPALGLSQILTSMGHELPALIAFRGPEGRYGPGFPFALHEAAPDADLLFARTGKHLAGLLRAYEPDLALCAAGSCAAGGRPARAAGHARRQSH